jgi:hypothetical protein
MECPPHLWKFTGKRDPYYVFAESKGRKATPILWVKCENCGQKGFRKEGSAVVYTCDVWEPKAKKS